MKIPRTWTLTPPPLEEFRPRTPPPPRRIPRSAPGVYRITARVIPGYPRVTQDKIFKVRPYTLQTHKLVIEANNQDKMFLYLMYM